MLAYFMAAYLMASIMYLILTSSIGTPFKDSLTPQQLEIKRSSSRARSRIFLLSMIVSAIILIIAQPFKECKMEDASVELPLN